MQAPCKDCKERCVGCHSTCSKYINFKNESARLHKLISDKKRIESLADRPRIKRRRRKGVIP